MRDFADAAFFAAPRSHVGVEDDTISVRCLGIGNAESENVPHDRMVRQDGKEMSLLPRKRLLFSNELSVIHHSGNPPPGCTPEDVSPFTTPS